MIDLNARVPLSRVLQTLIDNGELNPAFKNPETLKYYGGATEKAADALLKLAQEYADTSK